MKLLSLLSFFLVILFSSCGPSSSRHFEIGIDPSFYPAPLGASEDQVFGFSQDLLQAISKLQKVKLNPVILGSGSTFSGLRLKKYQGLLGSHDCKCKQNEWYSFSHPFLFIGPVLIVPIDSNLSSLSDFNSKIIGTLSNSDAYYLAQRYPKLVISTYSNAAFMLEALEYKDIDGALLEILAARNFVHNLYCRVFKINSEPLTDESLALITLKDAHPKLIKIFNEGLEECKRKGIYKNLLEKWELN